MPVIRVPIEAKPLLALCRKHELSPSEMAGPQCFDTYADLIVFAAAHGFAELSGRPPSRKKQMFLERPNPIDLNLFKNDRRFPQLLLIALATSKDTNVVRDEDLICKIVEDFAAVGCAHLVECKSSFHEGPHITLAKIMGDDGL